MQIVKNNKNTDEEKNLIVANEDWISPNKNE